MLPATLMFKSSYMETKSEMRRKQSCWFKYSQLSCFPISSLYAKLR